MSSKPDHRDMGSPRTCKGCTPIADTLTTDESVVSRTTPTKEPPQTHCSPTTLPPLTNCTYTLSPSYTVDCKTSLDNCSTNECYKLISLHTTDVPHPQKPCNPTALTTVNALTIAHPQSNLNKIQNYFPSIPPTTVNPKIRQTTLNLGANRHTLATPPTLIRDLENVRIPTKSEYPPRPFFEDYLHLLDRLQQRSSTTCSGQGLFLTGKPAPHGSLAGIYGGTTDLPPTAYTLECISRHAFLSNIRGNFLIDGKPSPNPYSIFGLANEYIWDASRNNLCFNNMGVMTFVDHRAGSHIPPGELFVAYGDEYPWDHVKIQLVYDLASHLREAATQLAAEAYTSDLQALSAELQTWHAYDLDVKRRYPDTYLAHHIMRLIDGSTPHKPLSDNAVVVRYVNGCVERFQHWLLRLFHNRHFYRMSAFRHANHPDTPSTWSDVTSCADRFANNARGEQMNKPLNSELKSGHPVYTSSILDHPKHNQLTLIRKKKGYVHPAIFAIPHPKFAHPTTYIANYLGTTNTVSTNPTSTTLATNATINTMDTDTNSTPTHNGPIWKGAQFEVTNPLLRIKLRLSLPSSWHEMCRINQLWRRVKQAKGDPTLLNEVAMIHCIGRKTFTLLRQHDTTTAHTISTNGWCGPLSLLWMHEKYVRQEPRCLNLKSSKDRMELHAFLTYLQEGILHHGNPDLPTLNKVNCWLQLLQMPRHPEDHTLASHLWLDVADIEHFHLWFKVTFWRDENYKSPSDPGDMKWSVIAGTSVNPLPTDLTFEDILVICHVQSDIHYHNAHFYPIAYPELNTPLTDIVEQMKTDIQRDLLTLIAGIDEEFTLAHEPMRQG